MASTFSTETLLELQGAGENGGTWGIKANNNFQIIDRSNNGYKEVSLATVTGGSFELTATNATLGDWQYRVLNFTGATGNTTVIFPEQKKFFAAINSSTGSAAVDLQTAAGGTIRLKKAEKGIFFVDGSDVQKVMSSFDFVSDPSNELSQQTGMISLTGGGTSAVRTITGSTGEIDVSNGNGTGGNPTVSLPSSLTFTGKTVNGGTFATITLEGAISATGATISDATISDATISNAALSGPTLTGTISATGASVRVIANDFRFLDLSDSTKAIKFSAGQVTTGQTREFSFPDETGDVVTRTATQILTNKTLSAPAISGAWSAASATCSNLGVVTTVDINGGSIDGAAIGASSPSTLVVTTGRATSGRIINQSTATNYTLVLSDAGKTVEQSNSSANTITIPANASVAYPVGADVAVVQTGTGVLSIATAATGVVVNSRGGLTDSAGQYAVLWLYKQATDTWILTGDLA